MGLDNLNLDEIKSQLAAAWDAEREVLGQLREVAGRIKGGVRKLGRQQASAVAFVAADGGDNRIRLDSVPGAAVAVVELARVVDLSTANSGGGAELLDNGEN